MDGRDDRQSRRRAELSPTAPASASPRDAQPWTAAAAVLRAHGLEDDAARLREANLALLARPEARFAEYFEPFTAEPLGSRDQSWTAAVTLDWLAAG